MSIKCKLGLHNWMYHLGTPLDDHWDIFVHMDTPVRQCSKCLKCQESLFTCLGYNPFTINRHWVSYNRKVSRVKPSFVYSKEDFEIYILRIEYYFLNKIKSNRDVYRSCDDKKLVKVRKKLLGYGLDPEDLAIIPEPVTFKCA